MDENCTFAIVEKNYKIAKAALMDMGNTEKTWQTSIPKGGGGGGVGLTNVRKENVVVNVVNSGRIELDER